MFRDWERLWLRESDYKNHRIFTLRCLHKDLVPVSIKLKSTLKTDRAKNIIRKAEKDLIQVRIKSITSILDNIGKQTQLCRSKLASIISTERLRECQGFIDKVGEIRFNKVKLRQSANILSGLWTRWRKDSTGLPDRLMMGAPTMPSLLTMKCKTRGTLSYPTHKVFVKVSKRFVVGMASKLTSKVAEISKTYWSPPRTKTLWSNKVVPSTGTNVVT